MTTRPNLHHVVFCVEPDHQDAAADVWRTLGFEFVEILLEDVSLRVLLDWTRGIEIVSPTTSDATVCRARSFLNEQGEGVYAVVVRTDAISAATESVRSYGVELTYRQSRSADSYTLEEAQFAPVFGMPITLLQTDLAG
jgi:4-hydroxyphenylpyruvate dioxygenase-like putative hemolysin